MLVLADFRWDISAGSLLIVLSVLGAVYGLYKMGPVGSETVNSLERLLNAVKLEKVEVEAQRDQAMGEAARLLAANATLRVDLARCEERPSTLELAGEIRAMQEGFAEHRDDLLHTQNQILGHLESVVGANKNMEQAVTILVEQIRHSPLRGVDSEVSDQSDQGGTDG